LSVKLRLRPRAALRKTATVASARWSSTWVPEGSLAGFDGWRKMALEWVSGADFSCTLMCGAGPGDLGGSRGSVSAQNPGKPGRKSPARLPLGSQSTTYPPPEPLFRVVGGCPEGRPVGDELSPLPEVRGGARHRGSPCGFLSWVPEGSLAGLGFPAVIDPRDPLRSPGPAPHINLHEKSAPQTNSKAKRRRRKNPAGLLSGTQLKGPEVAGLSPTRAGRRSKRAGRCWGGGWVGARGLRSNFGSSL